MASKGVPELFEAISEVSGGFMSVPRGFRGFQGAFRGTPESLKALKRYSCWVPVDFREFQIRFCAVSGEFRSVPEVFQYVLRGKRISLRGCSSRSHVVSVSFRDVPGKFRGFRSASRRFHGISEDRSFPNGFRMSQGRSWVFQGGSEALQRISRC